MNEEQFENAKVLILDYLSGVIKRVEEEIDDEDDGTKQVRRLKVIRKFLKEEAQKVSELTLQ